MAPPCETAVDTAEKPEPPAVVIAVAVTRALAVVGAQRKQIHSIGNPAIVVLLNYEIAAGAI